MRALLTSTDQMPRYMDKLVGLRYEFYNLVSFSFRHFLSTFNTSLNVDFHITFHMPLPLGLTSSSTS